MTAPEKIFEARGTVREIGPTSNQLSLSASEFLSRPLPVPRMLLPPWLVAGGLAMVHSWRGVGKTHFALGTAVAAASGSMFLRWKAPTPARVLYVDGEMPARAMAERLRAAIGVADAIPEGNFRLITPDMLPDNTRVPNLLTSEGQGAIEPDLDGRDLVVFDNIATLFRSTEDQNAVGSWMPAQDYILTLRRRGLSVLLVDHDNKSGGNRGTSGKEDVLDSVIQLKQPTDYLSSQGARFEVHFKKHRHFYGRDAAPFEAQLTSGPDGNLWTMKSADDAQFDRFAELMAAGVKERDIREELGVGGSTITRLKATLKNRGSE